MFSRQQIETLTQAILAHLAAHPELVQALAAETGIIPGDLRRMSGDPGFSQAMLDFIVADDQRLLDFAAGQGLSPADVAHARAALEAGAVI
ncbi:MAG TPA: DUF3572 family protein [Paracoccus sp. (in: a-proteobacteria)]|nr:DUF3572 family protein [Paracoccus sp. (in: a-proteobacteria)]